MVSGCGTSDSSSSSHPRGGRIVSPSRPRLCNRRDSRGLAGCVLSADGDKSPRALRGHRWTVRAGCRHIVA